jgi:hypothetical protein
LLNQFLDNVIIIKAKYDVVVALHWTPLLEPLSALLLSFKL